MRDFRVIVEDGIFLVNGNEITFIGVSYNRSTYWN